MPMLQNDLRVWLKCTQMTLAISMLKNILSHAKMQYYHIKYPNVLP